MKTMVLIVDDRYMVDNEGNVYSLRKNGSTRKAPLLMKQRLTKEGYMTVTLWDGKTFYPHLVHRLVATAFIPNPDEKPEVNHKNGVKTDNWKDNLEWATESENSIHAFQHGLRVGYATWKDRFNEHPSSQEIIQLTLDGQEVARFPSMKEAQRQGFSQGNISAVIEGKRKSHKGFSWARA